MTQWVTAGLIIIFPLLFAPFSISEEKEDYMRNYINDPRMSSWCQELLLERKHKMGLRAQTLDLLARGKKLIGQAPQKKKYLTKKLYIITDQIKRKLMILQEEITSLNERIVRKGCPGIKL